MFKHASHQICRLYDKAVAHAQRGVWRPHVGAVSVVDIHTWECRLHLGVDILEGEQHLRVNNIGDVAPLYDGLHIHVTLSQLSAHSLGYKSPIDESSYGIHQYFQSGVRLCTCRVHTAC